MNEIPKDMIQVSVMAAQNPKTGKYTAIPLYAHWDDLIGFSETARDYITAAVKEDATDEE